MKKALQKIVLVGYLTLCYGVTWSQIFTASSEKYNAISLRPTDFISDPSVVHNLWVNAPIPLLYYSDEEKTAQVLINENASHIITYAPQNQPTIYTRIDQEEITPYTWKWVDLRMLKSDSSTAYINLRRPNWWIKEAGADHIGNKIYLQIEELGIHDWGIVENIRINEIDTRLWDEQREGDYIKRPITGKFEYDNAEVYDLKFDTNTELVGATGQHPFWSVDRNQWINALNLNIGEKVKTQRSEVTLVSRTKRVGRHKVYNLEVYRDHTYLISTENILVHNTSDIRSMRIGDIMKSLDVMPNQTGADPEIVEHIVSRMSQMKAKSGKVNWEGLRLESPDKSDIWVGVSKDGRKFLLNGHHRVIAARISGVDIPWDNPFVVHFSYEAKGADLGRRLGGTWDNMSWDNSSDALTPLETPAWRKE